MVNFYSEIYTFQFLYDNNFKDIKDIYLFITKNDFFF